MSVLIYVQGKGKCGLYFSCMGHNGVFSGFSALGGVHIGLLPCFTFPFYFLFPCFCLICTVVFSRVGRMLGKGHELDNEGRS